MQIKLQKSKISSDRGFIDIMNHGIINFDKFSYINNLKPLDFIESHLRYIFKCADIFYTNEIKHIIFNNYKLDIIVYSEATR